MRKHQWRTCTNVGDMLRSLRLLRVSPRKLRLFGCACCRRIWDAIPDERSRDAVVVAESFADGTTGLAELDEARVRADDAYFEYAQAPVPPFTAYYATRACTSVALPIEGDGAQGWTVAVTVQQMQRMVAAGEPLPAVPPHPIVSDTMNAEKETMAAILRDIFWSPFQRIPFNAAWLTSDVLALARGIYEERAFDRMPILADALQDAGCNSDDVLNHCRDVNQPHVRGCWVVDLLLGKE
jgi:hypothetical protein